MEELVLAADDPLNEAGRCIMRQQLAKILSYKEQVHDNADMIAVHEMRKAIRRTFTCFRIFRPYFEPGTMKPFRRGLRPIMRRLGTSRDLSVFRLKLDNYNMSARRSLDDLSAYWQTQQDEVDRKLMHYLAKQMHHALLTSYQSFLETPGMGILNPNDSWAPTKTRHLLPILIYNRIASVRAYDEHIQDMSVKQLHRLRIQFKELRYSLQFFAPILGEEINSVLLGLKKSQEHLGDLNDATVALKLLDKMDGLDSSVATYRAFQIEEQERLVRSYMPIWRSFDQPDWRRDFALSFEML